MSPDRPPALGAGILKRAALAAVVIVLCTAGAVSAAGLLTADDLINVVEKQGRAPLAIPRDEIDRADAGAPQTIMLLGSDERYGDKQKGLKPRSDTILLARLDPDKPNIAVTSIPRDLQVQIPGVPFTTKINYAYQAGGVRRTLKTVKNLLSTPDRPFKVNHVIVAGFEDFRRAVDYLGCVYADIDRRYFNNNSPPTDSAFNYATIDVQPGYQKMCGRDALDYVRYRHGDTDLIRSARQQDFLRDIRQQTRVRQLMTWGKRREVAKMVGKFLQTSESLRHKKDLFRILQLVIYTAGKPIQEVPFRSHPSADNINVEASPDELRQTMNEFFAARSPSPKKPARRKGKGKGKKRSLTSVSTLVDARTEGEDQAVLAAKQTAKLPIYFPALKLPTASYAQEPRVYTIKDELGVERRAYRLVIHTGYIGEYYGVQGMRWRDPPILDNPSETRVDPKTGRKLQLFYDGKRLRIVAWRTKKAVYWVSNTLTRSLSGREMLGIAASLRKLGR